MHDLDDLLIKTSRTFGISIPLLPEPWRRQVTIAYLLFRIADTFEDADRWPPQARLDALKQFDAMLDGPAAAPAGWLDKPPCDHAGYLELLQATPFVLEELAKLDPEPRARVIFYTRRTIDGMSQYVARTDESGTLRLADMDDLRRYCYFVAGIVGELLTELFLIGQKASKKQSEAILGQARLFGEGLQLVNILKDSVSDAKEGRYYLPPSLDRAKVLSRARKSLEAARDYVLTVQKGGAPGGVLGFLIVPLVLAWATLDRVEKHGAGAKLTRPEVLNLLTKVQEIAREEKPKISAKTIQALYDDFKN